MKRNSPGREVWNRFRRNHLAVSGMLIILFSVFVSLFCYTFIPDRTPNAARMNLVLGNIKPGTDVKILKFRKQQSPESSSALSRIFIGVIDVHEHVAVNEYRFVDGKIIYKEYSSLEETDLPEKEISLAAALFRVDEDSPQNVDSGRLSFLSPDGKEHSEDISSMQAVFEKENVETSTFWLGTDKYGRDLLSRLLAGTRVTFGVGLLAVILSLLLGVFFGSMAGFFRGKVDSAVLWLINVVWSIPTLLLVIAITLVLGKGFEQVFIAVGITMWVDVARIVRGQLFSVRELEFVSAGRAMGFSSSRIVMRHMLPNIMGPVLVVAASNFSTAILLEAGLSFLGIGAQPPVPSWGAMIKENYGFIIIPGSAHLAIFPGLAIMLLTMAFTFVANGLRDALDSRQQISLGA